MKEVVTGGKLKDTVVIIENEEGISDKKEGQRKREGLGVKTYGEGSE